MQTFGDVVTMHLTNDELQEGESAAGRLTRLEDAGQLHRLSRWEKHQLMADMFSE